MIFFCLSFLLLFIDEFRFPSSKFLIVLCNISCRLKEVFLHYKYDKTWCLVQTMNLKQTFWLNLTLSKTPSVSNKLYQKKGKGRKIKMYSNLLRVIITGINLFKQRRITVFNDTILCEQILFQKGNEKQKVSSSLLTRAYLGFVFKFCSTPGNLCKTNRV